MIIDNRDNVIYYNYAKKNYYNTIQLFSDHNI